MTDYTDPLGKWVEENISRFTEKIAVDNRPFPIIDSLAMLRAYVAEVAQPQMVILTEERDLDHALREKHWNNLQTAETELATLRKQCELELEARNFAQDASMRKGIALEKLEAELVAARSELDKISEWNRRLKELWDTEKAALLEARRDSARLEWVVKNRAIAYPTSAVERPWICYVRTGRDREHWGGTSFREAIDAAMAEAQPKEAA